jgi:hypothetical protein
MVSRATVVAGITSHQLAIDIFGSTHRPPGGRNRVIVQSPGVTKLHDVVCSTVHVSCVHPGVPTSHNDVFQSLSVVRELNAARGNPFLNLSLDQLLNALCAHAFSYSLG